METALAAVFVGHKQPFALRYYPVTPPPAGYARLRLIASGVCGTDVQTFDGASLSGVKTLELNGGAIAGTAAFGGNDVTVAFNGGAIGAESQLFIPAIQRRGVVETGFFNRSAGRFPILCRDNNPRASSA